MERPSNGSTNGCRIAGATSSSYTTPATKVADSGTKFKVQVTNSGSNVTSDEVALTVVDLAPPASPTLTLNFDDGALPTGTVLIGTPDSNSPAISPRRAA